MRELVTFFAFSEFESFIEYFESWAPSGRFYVYASWWATKSWDQFCYLAVSRGATPGSLTLQEVFFSRRDLDVVIEAGMPEGTVGVPTPRAGVSSHLAEEWRAFVASFPSDGEERKWVLLWGAGPASLILPDLPSTSCWIKLGEDLFTESTMSCPGK